MNEQPTLEEYVSNSEIVQLAITEAVHRYYHDECFFKKYKFVDTENNLRASSILSNLWCLNPDWRYKLFIEHKRNYICPGTIDSLNTYNKPKQTFATEINIKFNLIA